MIGAVALAAACRALSRIGMRRIAEEEEELIAHARKRLARIPGVTVYSLWEDHPRIGVITFNIEGLEHHLLAAVLGAEYGVGVRAGCFCAHPLMLRPLGVPNRVAAGYRARLRAGRTVRLPGAVRMSFGLDTTLRDIDIVAGALEEIAAEGARWTYRRDPGGNWHPVPDPRGLPRLPARLDWAARGRHEASGLGGGGRWLKGGGNE